MNKIAYYYFTLYLSLIGLNPNRGLLDTYAEKFQVDGNFVLGSWNYPIPLYSFAGSYRIKRLTGIKKTASIVKRFWIKGRIRSFMFLCIFTVAFLLFSPCKGSTPAGLIF